MHLYYYRQQKIATVNGKKKSIGELVEYLENIPGNQLVKISRFLDRKFGLQTTFEAECEQCHGIFTGGIGINADLFREPDNTLYKEGFEKIDDLPDEIQQEFYKVRESEISHMLELQFILSYLGNISKADSDEMTWFELNNWFKLLKKQKDIENQRALEQIK